MSSKKWWGAPLVGVALAVAGCGTNPVTGAGELQFVSLDQEIQLGKKSYGPTREAQGGDYVVDKQLLAYVRKVGNRLADVSDRKLPYEFNIVNDSTPNAWALPGGKIALNRGLLTELNSEAELAAVLGHEIVHAAARHSAQTMERGVLLQGVLVAAGVALSDSDYRDVGMLGAGLAGNLTQLKYGRDAELEADTYGMRYMVRAGYDPAAAVDLQKTFVRLFEEKRPGWVEGMFASHPPSHERVDNNRQLVAKLGNPGGDMGRERYQHALAQLKRDTPAYAAYAKGRKALQNGDSDTALRLADQAIALQPQEALFHGLRGDALAKAGKSRAANNSYDEAIALNPGHFRFPLMRGLVRSELGDKVGAQRDLVRSLELLPTAEGHYVLGLMAAEAGQTRTATEHLQVVAQSNGAVADKARQALRNLQSGAVARPQSAANANATLGLDAARRDVRLAAGLYRDGKMYLILRNDGRQAYHQIAVLLHSRGGGRQLVQVGRVLKPGHSLRVATGIGPLTTDDVGAISAQISAAQVVE